MTPAPSIAAQIGYAEGEAQRYRGVYPQMVCAGVMAQSAMDDEVALQDAIVASLRRLELFLLLSAFGEPVPVEFIEQLRSPAHQAEVRAKLEAVGHHPMSAAHG